MSAASAGTGIRRFRMAENSIGTWLKLPTIVSAELAALASLDFVVIDLEHSTIPLDTAASMIAVLRRTETRPFVRVPDHGATTIQRMLDAGATGVIAPHVESADEARAVVRAARFHPRGERGFGPTSRAGDWGLTPWSTFLAGGDEVGVIAQIESRKAVAEVDQIMAEDIDAVLVGAADLSVELGATPDDPAVTEAMQNVRERAQAAGMPCGTATGAASAAVVRARSDGYDFVIAGNDASVLGLGLRSLRPVE